MAEVEVWRGSVAAWECDAMGHLNVGFYVAHAMEGLAGLAAELGMPAIFAPAAAATLVVREQYIRFLREARANAPLSMTGGVLEMGETDARLLLLIRHHGGDLAAGVQMTVSHATAREARPFPWPERVRARAEALATQVPDGAGARSIALTPVETQASLARAEAMGLTRTGFGAVAPGDCDAFGRMRTEMFMHRLSHGVPHLFAAGRAAAAEIEPKTGGAVLEYRLLHHAWPRAGDRLDLRAGAAGGDARVRRLAHWMLDPATGRPWMTAEAISVSFDLEARRIITLTPEAVARMQAESVPGLGL